MIKLIIFDLDGTLVDSRGLLADQFIKLFPLKLDKSKYLEHGTKYIREEVYKVTDRKLSEIYNKLNLSELKPYDDISVLDSIPIKMVLVTSGDIKFQNKKIDCLNIRKYFDKVYINVGNDYEGKLSIFKYILTEYNLTPIEVLVVGDNRDSEIKACLELGMLCMTINRPCVGLDTIMDIVRF